MPKVWSKSAWPSLYGKCLARKPFALCSSSSTSNKKADTDNKKNLDQIEHIEKTIREELSVPAKVFEILERQKDSIYLDSNKIKGS
jgi:hypothetical protein